MAALSVGLLATWVETHSNCERLSSLMLRTCFSLRLSKSCSSCFVSFLISMLSVTKTVVMTNVVKSNTEQDRLGAQPEGTEP